MPFPFLKRPSETEIKLVMPEHEHRRLPLRPLPEAAKEGYSSAWEALQRRFPDEPEAAIRDSDRLMQGIMRERGYPTGDFGRVNLDLTPEDVEILSDYRIVHRISVKAETDFILPEQVEQALGALHRLFDALIAQPTESTS
ncbi:MAG: hypothetical protein JOY59_04185 [Candidatus Eremiobacteraeota bacterium]|nr:hypothetical protein [Candidatus Eremiobacteraeota bacterium]